MTSMGFLAPVSHIVYVLPLQAFNSFIDAPLEFIAVCHLPVTAYLVIIETSVTLTL